MAAAVSLLSPVIITVFRCPCHALCEALPDTAPLMISLSSMTLRTVTPSVDETNGVLPAGILLSTILRPPGEHAAH